MAKPESIAIVGMAARFPGAANLAAFWELLREGRDAVSRIPKDREFGLATMQKALTPEQRSAVMFGGFIADIDQFDAAFFGVSAAEAKAMDPKQRLALESAWCALEDAAIAPDSLRGSRTGVFIGTSVYDYYERLFDASAVDAYFGSGNFNCVIANRISYLLDLRGPSMAIETACSASLTALHQACSALRDGSCELALAGGAMTLLSPSVTVSFALGGFLAPDGRCKAFDDGANGYVRGEGAGMVVLKRLADAEANGDRIYAVVEASVLNQDGRSNGLTAPNPRAQEALLREACASAEVAPARIDYVEAHGTGTRLGDPIEVNALGAVLGNGRATENPLRIGSVKTNIGHLEAAAGIAGVIKTSLALYHGMLPPSLHFDRPNTLIAFARQGVVVQDRLTDWPLGNDGRRWAGVSAFSFAGANAHVVLASAPATPSTSIGGAPVRARAELLVLSGKTDTALAAQIANLNARLQAPERPTLSDVAWTLQRGRALFRQRAAWVVPGDAAPIPVLLRSDVGWRGEANMRAPKVAFLFPGQGAQFAGMAASLYEHWPAFRERFDRCAGWMRGLLDIDLVALCLHGDATVLSNTTYTQPALFAMQWSLADALMTLGLQPCSVLGHSIGEYAAAAVAGIFTPEAAAHAVCARARAIAAMPAGTGMTSVRLDANAVSALLQDDTASLTIAAINAPDSVTVAGGLDALAALEYRLTAMAVKFVRLDVSHAFHSPAMAAAQAPFRAALGVVNLSASRIPIYSSRDGVQDRGAMSQAEYWVDQIAAPVQYAAAVKALLGAGADMVLEIGPTSGLLALARRTVPQTKAVLQTTQERHGDGWSGLLTAVARWFVCGGAPQWHVLGPNPGSAPVSLPCYPFSGQRHWYEHNEPRPVSSTAETAPADKAALVPTRLALAVPQQVYSGQAGLKSFPELAGHMVFGEIILPGTFSLSAALETQADASGRAVLRDLQWPSAASLSTEAAEPEHALQVVVAANEVSVHLQTKPDGAWQCLLVGATSLSSTAVESQETADPSDFARILDGDDAKSVSAFYDQLDQLGLSYRSPFRAVSGVHRHGDHVLARVAVPGSMSAAMKRVVLLDAAMHPCAMFELSAVHVPFALERLCWHGHGSDSWIVRWTRRQEHTGHDGDLLLDGAAYDGNGQLIAAWHGLHLRRTRQFRMQPAATSALAWQTPPAGSLLHREWLPRDGAGLQMPAVLPKFDPVPVPAAVQDYREAIATLEAGAHSYLPAVLAAFGFPAAAGGSMPLSGLQDIVAALPRHRARLLERCVARAEATGLLRREGLALVWTVSADPSQSLANLPKGAFAETDYEARLLDCCLRALPDVVAGRRDAVSLLFQGEGSAVLNGVYGGSVGAVACNQMLADVLAALQRQLPSGRTMRVLEVGAGTGATTERILATADKSCLDYVFTDVSAAFMVNARERFSDELCLRFQVLDLERDDSPAGLEAESFDAIVAANVVHATRDIGVSLARLQRLLRPGGYLLLLEVTEAQLWLDFTFGLTEGWWAFQDERVDSALLPVASWQQQLQRHGFESIHERAGDWALHQRVLVARKPLSHAAWSLVDAVADTDHGQVSNLQSAVRQQRLLDSDGKVVATCLHLRRQNVPSDAAAAALLALQRLRDRTTGIPDRLFVLTHGAQSVLPEEPVGDLGGAAVQGLVRAFDLENPEFRATLIDIDAEADVDAQRLTSLLRDEWQSGGSERELAWRQGQRFVHRVQAWQPSLNPDPRRLNVGRGSLDELSLGELSVRSPSSGEVQIRVTWSGINFLDLLDALGTLPFHRAEGLGSECVGQIEALAPDVTGFAVGDWVMAIAPGAMASAVTVDSRYVCAVPRHWPLQQAVGVPVAFLTGRRAVALAAPKAGDWVLVHAAAGATGFAAMQWARARGARVIATASRHKANWVRAHGAEAVFDSRDVRFAEAVKQTTNGHGVAAVINSLTSPGFIEASLSGLAIGGRFVELAKQGIWSLADMRSRRPDVCYHVLDLYQEVASDPDSVAQGFKEIVAIIDRAQIPLLPVRSAAPEQAVSLFRTMQRGQHLGKLAVQWQHRVSARQLGTDLVGSYLITGGTGGLGLLVARWLAMHGARHLVLVSRRGAVSDDALTTVAWLESRGVQVELPTIDVTDHVALSELCRKFGRDWPAARGVFHAAGVLADGLLPNQTSESLVKVMSPKLAAACTLADHLSTPSLHCFVLFSSVAGLFGSAGQSNHSAANAALDGLAATLRARGLPAVSIALGTVAEVGAAAALGADRRVASKGILALQSMEALAAIELAISSGLACLTAVPMRWAEADATLRQRAMFLNLPVPTHVSASTSASKKAAEALSVDWRALPETARVTSLSALVEHELAKVLGFATADLDLQQGFTDLGIDSLGAVEMRNRLQRALGFNLPSSLLFDHPNVHALSQYLARRLSSIDASSAAMASAPAEPATGKAASTDMNESDVRKRLGDKLAQLRRGAIV